MLGLIKCVNVALQLKWKVESFFRIITVHLNVTVIGKFGLFTVLDADNIIKNLDLLPVHMFLVDIAITSLSCL